MKRLLNLLLILAGLSMISACVQMPTEKTGVADLRPALTFKLENSANQTARVHVDGLDMGQVEAYLEGKAVLRVLPGTHRVQILSGSTVLLDEKMYLADGVVRTLVVR